MGIPSCFSANFAKGRKVHDFMFAYFDGVDLPKSGLLLKDVKALLRASMSP